MTDDRRAGSERFVGWRDASGDVQLPEEERRNAFFHVTPSANRESIRIHGLDWARMGLAPGLASGEPLPEEAAVYLARREEVDWFLGMPRHAEGLDVWEVNVVGLDLVLTTDGFVLCREPISGERLTLKEKDVSPAEARLRREGR